MYGRFFHKRLNARLYNLFRLHTDDSVTRSPFWQDVITFPSHLWSAKTLYFIPGWESHSIRMLSVLCSTGLNPVGGDKAIQNLLHWAT